MILRELRACPEALFDSAGPLRGPAEQKNTQCTLTGFCKLTSPARVRYNVSKRKNGAYYDQKL